MTEIDLPNSKGQDAALDYDAATQFVYVALADGTLQAVDAARKTGAHSLKSLPDASAIVHDDANVYVVGKDAQQLQVVRKADWSVVASSPLPEAAAGSLWLDGKRERVYVPTRQGNLLTYSAGAAPQALGTTPLGPNLGHVAGSADTLYAASGSQVLALGLDSGQVRSSAPQSGPITGVTYDSRTELVWLTTADHHLMAVNGQTLQPEHVLMAKSADSLSFDPDLRFIYTFGSGGFGAYDTNTNEQWAQVDVGDSSVQNGVADAVNHLIFAYLADAGKLAIYAWGVTGSGPVTGGGGGGTAPLGAAGSTSSAGNSSGAGSASAANSSGASGTSSLGGSSASPAGATSSAVGGSGIGNGSTSTNSNSSTPSNLGTTSGSSTVGGSSSSFGTSSGSSSGGSSSSFGTFSGSSSGGTSSSFGTTSTGTSGGSTGGSTTTSGSSTSDAGSTGTSGGGGASSGSGAGGTGGGGGSTEGPGANGSHGSTGATGGIGAGTVGGALGGATSGI